jgi:hypothetical protein
VEVSKTKNLYELWAEWTHGIGGKKAVSEWTEHERGGKNKQKIWLRMPFWKCVDLLIRAGYSYVTAIDKIYAVYGKRSSVTKVLQAMHKDKKTYKQQGGFHPELAVNASSRQ